MNGENGQEVKYLASILFLKNGNGSEKKEEREDNKHNELVAEALDAHR